MEKLCSPHTKSTFFINCPFGLRANSDIDFRFFFYSFCFPKSVILVSGLDTETACEKSSPFCRRPDRFGRSLGSISAPNFDLKSIPERLRPLPAARTGAGRPAESALVVCSAFFHTSAAPAMKYRTRVPPLPRNVEHE